MMNLTHRERCELSVRAGVAANELRALAGTDNLAEAKRRVATIEENVRLMDAWLDEGCPNTLVIATRDK